MNTTTKEVVLTKVVELTPAEHRAALIAAKVLAGLKKDQAVEVVDKQIKHDAWLKTEEAKRLLAPHATSPAGGFGRDPRLTELEAEQLDEHEERITALEAARVTFETSISERMSALEKKAATEKPETKKDK